jgi:hypothetical protein
MELLHLRRCEEGTMDIIEMLNRRVDHLFDRASGPLNFRLVIMPLVVTILAIRAHLRDVREGRPTVPGAFFRDPTKRRRLLRSGLKDIGKVFIVACVLDTTYQILVLRSFYPGEVLVVAVACAIVPYVLFRGPVTRLTRRLYRKWAGPANISAANTTEGTGRRPEHRDRADV